MNMVPQKFQTPLRSRITQALVWGQMALLLVAIGAGTAWAQPQTPPAVIQTASEIRQLGPEQAAQRLPVRIRGVVTFWDNGLYSRFVQDASAGIYLQEMTNMPPISPGQMVEVEGFTGPGEYAPVIVPTKLQVVADGQFPAPRPVTAADLVGGTEDSQFVEISGIVRSVRYEEETQYHLIEIVTGGERFTAFAKELPVAQPGALVDSTIKVRGVCSTEFNRLRQLFGFRLLVARPGDVIVEKNAPANPFDLPAQSINKLLQFTPKATYGHRVKVTGTVSFQESGRAVFIQDETEGLHIQTRQRTPLQPGDVVEVLGFPSKGEYTPMLQDAIYRRTVAGKPPTPVDLEVDEVLKGTHDCRLIRLKANLLERTRRGREQFLVLETGGFTFHAYFGQDADVAKMDHVLNGSELSVTGICLIERGSGWQAGEGWRASSFRLLLPTADHVQVLAAPPWWTQPNKLRVAGIISVLVLALLVLIDVLRRRPKATNVSK
jgi:hypothetical protein